MRKLVRLFRFFFFRQRSLTVVSILFVVSLVCAFSTGFWLVSRLANVILVSVPVAYVWARLNLRGLEGTVERPVDRLQEGNFFEERVAVVNRGWLAKLWLEVEDPSELPGFEARRVISLGPRSQRPLSVLARCWRLGLEAAR